MYKKQNSVLVLLSGGIDSAACVKYYLNEKFNVASVFVDYGQKAAEREYNGAKKIADFYDIELNLFPLKINKKFSSGEIKGRNAILILSTLMNMPGYQGIISLGIHSGTPYYDCSESFVKNMNDIVEGYTDGMVQLDTPFLKWDKKMIYEYCKDNNVPIELTYSCEKGEKKPCGKCLSCLDRSLLDVG